MAGGGYPRALAPDVLAVGGGTGSGRVTEVALLGAAGKAEGAEVSQRHSPVAAERGLIAGTAARDAGDAWLGAPQASLSRGPERWCRERWCRAISRASGLSGGCQEPEGGQEAVQGVPRVGLISPWDPPAPARTARTSGRCAPSTGEGRCQSGPAQVSLGRQGPCSGSLAGCLDGFSEATAVPRPRPTFLWSEAPWFFPLAHSGLSKESLTAAS